MKGRNTMILNAGTMQAALQYYFETIVFAEGVCPIVTHIEQQFQAGSSVKQWHVTVEEAISEDVKS